MSPELALVDPGLADWARERLPEPPDTLVRAPSASSPPSSRAPEAASALVASGTLPSAPPITTGPPARRRKRGAIRVGAVAVVAVTVLLADVRLPIDETPTSDDPSTLGEPPAVVDSDRPPPPATPSTVGRSARGFSGPRRFAWAPSAEASGYHVELFRGSALVFRAETTKPEIVIRRRWRLDGKEHRLRPGEYRWYVWPRVAGRRKAKAIVQAKLLVPPR